MKRANFDVNKYEYTKEAYEMRKWAFVSDVVRLEVIYQNGGVYLDTDVEIVGNEPFADFLEYNEFLVFETERSINTGLCFGGSKGSPLCRALLESYLNNHYSKETETVNSLTNKPVFQQKFPELKWNGKNQIHGDTYIMGTETYGQRMKHYGTRSWCDDLPEYKISGFWKLKKFLRNPNFVSFLESRKLLNKVVPVYIFCVYDLLDLGPMYYLKRLALKVKNRKKK